MVYFIVLVLQLRRKSNRFLYGVGVKEKFKPSSLFWRNVICAKLRGVIASCLSRFVSNSSLETKRFGCLENRSDKPTFASLMDWVDGVPERLLAKLNPTRPSNRGLAGTEIIQLDFGVIVTE